MFDHEQMFVSEYTAGDSISTLRFGMRTNDDFLSSYVRAQFWLDGQRHTTVTVHRRRGIKSTWPAVRVHAQDEMGKLL